MNLTATDRKEGRVGCRLLPPPATVTVKLLMQESHVRRVAVLSPPPGEGSSLAAADLVERARRITALMEEILAQAEAVPHGGINE